jgi:hypothetical protein
VRPRLLIANRQFKFDERSQLFIGVHNEPLSVVAMCISDPDRSPAAQDRAQNRF